MVIREYTVSRLADLYSQLLYRVTLERLMQHCYSLIAMISPQTDSHYVPNLAATKRFKFHIFIATLVKLSHLAVLFIVRVMHTVGSVCQLKRINDLARKTNFLNNGAKISSQHSGEDAKHNGDIFVRKL